MTAIDTKKLRELCTLLVSVNVWARIEPETVIQLLDEIDRQKEQIAVAKAALEFYAQPDVYEERITFKGTRPPGVLAESGDFARAALKRLGEG